MGSRLKRWLYNQRFSTAKPIKQPNCVTKITQNKWKIGPYTLEKIPQGYHLTKNGKTIGTYPKAKIQTNRILLEKDLGMLLEVTAKGHRNILTIHKARLIAGICGDGSVTRGKGAVFKFINSDPKLIKMFLEALEKTYGKINFYTSIDYRKENPVTHIYVSNRFLVEDVYKYCKKRGAEYWRIPIKYLDREAAREFINFYFSCDGSFDYRPKKGMRVIIFKSKCREALEDVKEVLEKFFNIQTRYKTPDHNKSKCTYYYRLVVSRKRNLKKFFQQGLTSYRGDHEIIIRELKRWALK